MKEIYDKDINDDEAHELATSIWRDVTNKSDCDTNNSLFRFKDYLKNITQKSKGFACDLSIDIYRAINGAIWKTATMCNDFERWRGHFS